MLQECSPMANVESMASVIRARMDDLENNMVACSIGWKFVRVAGDDSASQMSVKRIVSLRSWVEGFAQTPSRGSSTESYILQNKRSRNSCASLNRSKDALQYKL